jgi:hypothetical protein
MGNAFTLLAKLDGVLERMPFSGCNVACHHL